MTAEAAQGRPGIGQTYYYVMEDGRRVPNVSKVMTATEAAKLNQRQEKMMLHGRWKTEDEIAGGGQRSRVYRLAR